MPEKVTTTDGQQPDPGFEHGKQGAPKPINPATGQHFAYFVLTEEERAKGFVRPIRDAYRHVGTRPQHLVRDLTEQEKIDFSDHGYVKFEEWPVGTQAGIGRFWTHAELESGCGTVTTMSREIAETYARNPKFYQSTFCLKCRKHIPVREFTWLDNPDEIVGS